MKNRLLFVPTAFLLTLVSCNNTNRNIVSPEAFNFAISFASHKSFSYTIIGYTPINSFVDEVKIDENKIYILFNDSEKGKSEYYGEVVNDELTYKYTYADGVWKKEKDTGFIKMFRPTYYFTKFIFDDFIYVEGAKCYVSKPNKVYVVDPNSRVGHVKLHFDNNQLVNAEYLLLDSDEKTINHIMNYTYTYKSVSVTLPTV